MSPRALLFLFLLLPAVPTRADSFQSWAARAERATREKNETAAFEAYSNAIASWVPSNGKAAKARALRRRAALRARRGDDAGAIRDYSASVALARDAKAYHARGVLLLKAGRVESAISDFYRAVALSVR